MKTVVAGGIIEKDSKFLLVRETQKICKGKWGFPSGAVDEFENVIVAAKREIFEETGCEVRITGILEIINQKIENKDLVCFIFNTQLIKENNTNNKEEISEARWFTYEEILNMKKNLRADGFFLNAIQNKLNNKIYPLDLINTNPE